MAIDIKDFVHLHFPTKDGSGYLGETNNFVTVVGYGRNLKRNRKGSNVPIVGYLLKCVCGEHTFINGIAPLRDGRVKTCGCKYNIKKAAYDEFLIRMKGQLNKAGILYCSFKQYTSEKIPYWCSKHNIYKTISKEGLRTFLYAPCELCAKEHCGGHNVKSNEAFIEESKSVWGTKYTYENTKYITNKKKVTITCKEHGIFDQNAGNHLAGSEGCKGCSPNCGFDKSKAGELYVVEWENRIYDFIKFGITNKATEHRIAKQSNRREGITFQPNILHIFKFNSGEECADLELKISQAFETGVVSKEEFPDGFSETVKTSDYPILLNFIESQLPNYKSYQGTRHAIH